MNASPQHNITALLDEAALRHPERSALVFGTKRLTFAALHAHVARCARQLREHGLQAGQRVIIMTGGGAGATVMDGKLHEIHTIWVKAFDKAGNEIKSSPVRIFVKHKDKEPAAP